MPFTFAHPAIILPLNKYQKFFSFTALVVGSVAPDFEYFIRFQPKSTVSHTLLGVFIFNLPLTLLLGYLFHRIVKKNFIQHLPSPFDSWFKIIADQDWNIYSLSGLFIFIYSALVGILSHILWDSFTHIHGFFVAHIPLLSTTIVWNIPLYKILQHLSTLLGMVIILLFLNKIRYKNLIKNPIHSINKIKYWGILFLFMAIIYSYILFSHNFSINIGNFITSIISSFLLATLAISLLYIKKSNV